MQFKIFLHTHYHTLTRAGLIFYSPLSSVRTTDISSLAPEGWGGTQWTVLPTLLILLFFQLKSPAQIEMTKAVLPNEGG